jgi:hypothetical protein
MADLDRRFDVLSPSGSGFYERRDPEGRAHRNVRPGRPLHRYDDRDDDRDRVLGDGRRGGDSAPALA